MVREYGYLSEEAIDSESDRAEVLSEGGHVVLLPGQGGFSLGRVRVLQPSVAQVGQASRVGVPLLARVQCPSSL